MGPPARSILAWPGGRCHGRFSTILSGGRGALGWRGDTCSLASSEFLGLLCGCSERSRLGWRTQGFLAALGECGRHFCLGFLQVP